MIFFISNFGQLGLPTTGKLPLGVLINFPQAYNGENDSITFSHMFFFNFYHILFILVGMRRTQKILDEF